MHTKVGYNTCLCIGQKIGYFSIPFNLIDKADLELVQIVP